MSKPAAEQLRRLLLEDKLEELLDLLNAHCLEQASVVALLGRLSALRKETMHGTAARNEIEISRNQIRESVQTLLVKIERSDSAGTTENESSSNISQPNPEPMYRESWASAPNTDASPLPVTTAMTTFKALGQIRASLNTLDCNMAGFKPDLSKLVNQLGQLLGGLESALKSSGNEGHRMYRIVLEAKHRSSDTKSQLLKANDYTPNGRNALVQLYSRELVHLSYSLEKLEAMLKEEHRIHPN